MAATVKRSAHGVAGLFLLLYGLLAWDAARRLSPTWDEIVYPAAGVVQWRTGALQINTEHPYLTKLLVSLPVLLMRPSLPNVPMKDPYRYGYQFTFHNEVQPECLLLASRAAAVAIAVATAALLYFWMASVWGLCGGLAALLAYMAVPVFSARASLALLEGPMYLFILFSLWRHDRWTKTQRPRDLVLAGAGWGAALLCKMGAFPLGFAYLLIHAVRAAETRRWAKEIQALVIVFAVASGVFVGSYLVWSGGWAAMKDVLGTVVSWNAQRAAYFWHGQMYAQAPSAISLAVFLIKAPLIVLILAIWGGVAWVRQGTDSTWLHLVSIAAASLSSILFFQGAVASVHFSPAFIGFAGLVAPLGTYLVAGTLRQRWLVRTLLAAALIDAGQVHPNYLTYFNFFVGGPEKGYRWLGDSDQDWGQALPEVATYQRRHPQVGLLLAYSGPGDPRAWGIRYQDLLSPALVTAEYRGEPIDLTQRVQVVAATKLLQTEPRYFSWAVQHLTPVARLENSFVVYDISGNAEAFRWIGSVYLETRRPQEAQRAFEQAQRIDPTKDVEELLKRLKTTVSGVRRSVLRNQPKSKPSTGGVDEDIARTSDASLDEMLMVFIGTGVQHRDDKARDQDFLARPCS